MCRLRNIAKRDYQESDYRTDRRTDRRRTKRSHRKRHNNLSGGCHLVIWRSPDKWRPPDIFFSGGLTGDRQINCKFHSCHLPASVLCTKSVVYHSFITFIILLSLLLILYYTNNTLQLIPHRQVTLFWRTVC